MKKLMGLVVLAISLLVCLPVETRAISYSDSELNVLWDQLTIAGGTLNQDYEIRWTYYGGHSEADANNGVHDIQSNSSFNPDVPVTTLSSSGPSDGRAYVGKDLATSAANATATGLGATTNSSANANAHFRWDLTILNDVELTFEVPYTYSEQLYADYGDEGASVYSRFIIWIDEYLENSQLLRAGEDVVVIENVLHGSGDDISSGSGTLGFTAQLYPSGDGHTGWYWFEGHAHDSGSAYSSHQGTPQPVPEPATLLLLGGGFLGLLRLRLLRRRA